MCAAYGLHPEYVDACRTEERFVDALIAQFGANASSSFRYRTSLHNVRTRFACIVWQRALDAWMAKLKSAV